MQWSELTSEERQAIRSAARGELWRRLSRGEVSCDFLLHPGQERMLAWLRQNDSLEPWLNIGRQWGKSTALLAYVLEQMWLHPHSLYVWFGPHRSDVVQILSQKLKPLLLDCPQGLQPVTKFSSPVTMTLPNGACLELLGLNNEQAAGFRGRSIKKAIIDEASEVDGLDSVIEDVILPGLLHGGQGKQIICSGTPSLEADHPSYARVNRALAAGNGYHATSRDNPWADQKALDAICETLGGPQSPSWLREFEARLDVTDPDAVLCPEFTRLKAELTLPWERPDYYRHLRRLVSIDRGGDTEKSDGTGLSFWTYDFPTQTAHVEAAHLLRSPSTREIIDLVKAEERRLWPGLPPPARIGDGILAKDFAVEGLIIGKPAKDDRDAAIALLRTTVGQRHLHVEPTAEVAIAQLQHAHARRGRLARGPQGHYDVFDSILYGNRYCHDTLKRLNPIPVEPRPWDRRPVQTQHSPLLKAFAAPRR